MAEEVREVRVGLTSLPRPLTYRQAKRYGEQHMPADLRQAGFVTSVFVSDPEINGALFFRVNYGKCTLAKQSNSSFPAGKGVPHA